MVVALTIAAVPAPYALAQPVFGKHEPRSYDEAIIPAVSLGGVGGHNMD